MKVLTIGLGINQGSTDWDVSTDATSQWIVHPQSMLDFFGNHQPAALCLLTGL